MRAFRLTCPACFHDAVAETFGHLGSVGAIVAVYLDTSRHGNKAEYLVAVDGVTAFGQLEVDAFQVLVNNQYIFLATGFFLQGCLQVVALGAAVH
ncbi:hypothetical protein SDC9_184082 [bioreactor metagenome]|uniref:Uncharacterized protein n=1 Tax=bioreactor metagenome TaxID=1076179 RepID=A0A645HLS0_9ZZZZ